MHEQLSVGDETVRHARLVPLDTPRRHLIVGPCLCSLPRLAALCPMHAVA
jgi:hypothetical protein